MPEQSYRDPQSVAGATLPIHERTALLVVGAGPAGLAAATAAAEAGQAVVLIDENPIPAETMGDDVPHFFGNRMTGAVRNRAAMTEAFIASDPAIARAFDAGVDLRLGTTCYGLYAPGPSVGWLPGPVAALTDGTRSWMLAAPRVVVATGRRDMALAFDNWTQPGVMGMHAATLLLRYGVLDVRRAVILGTTPEAIHGAHQLAAAGIEILALVEPGPNPIADPSPFPTLCNHTVLRAETGPGGVTACILAGPGGELRLGCDTIIEAVGAVPLIELLDSAHCRTAFDPSRGGPVPILDPIGHTTTPGIYAVGDCAGIWDAKTRNPAIAAAEGRRAALALPNDAPDPTPSYDLAAYRTEWVRTALLAATAEPHVCQCEGVTARDILEVRPPRYLGASTGRRNMRSLASLLGHPEPNPDHIKRLTRAGMGLCQGRRCREQVAALLALGSGLPLAQIPLATHRAPVRPLPLHLAAATDEDPRIAARWDVWFGMPSQYAAPWDVPSHHTATRPME